MRLTVTTPLEVLVDDDGVDYVRAEDATGSFGIQPGHEDFVTVLGISVLVWRSQGAAHYAAIGSGVLRVDGGQVVQVAARRALVSDDLHHLEEQVLEEYRRAKDREDRARRQAKSLQVNLMHRLRRFIRSERHVPGGLAASTLTGFDERGTEEW